MDARLATPVETRGQYTVMWDGQCGDWTTHVARRDMGPMTTCPDLNSNDAEDWGGACERCGEVIPWNVGVPCDCEDEWCTEKSTWRVSSGLTTIWDTPSGALEPGCLYFEQPSDYEHWCPGKWSNCDQRHLHAVLPNGHYWDIDSRASNCGSPQDFTHRCWVRHGEPPMVHVDKNGQTCTAGAGSIAAGDYHGFLHNGQFTGV